MMRSLGALLLGGMLCVAGYIANAATLPIEGVVVDTQGWGFPITGSPVNLWIELGTEGPGSAFWDPDWYTYPYRRTAYGHWEGDVYRLVSDDYYAECMGRCVDWSWMETLDFKGLNPAISVPALDDLLTASSVFYRFDIVITYDPVCGEFGCESSSEHRLMTARFHVVPLPAGAWLMASVLLPGTVLALRGRAAQRRR